METITAIITILLAGLRGIRALLWLLGVRFIPPRKVGIVEKTWSLKGLLRGARVARARGEAGFQTEVLHGGVHFFYFPWQYRIHKLPLIPTDPSRPAGVSGEADGERPSLAARLVRLLLPEPADRGRRAAGEHVETYLATLAERLRKDLRARSRRRSAPATPAGAAK